MRSVTSPRRLRLLVALALVVATAAPAAASCYDGCHAIAMSFEDRGLDVMSYVFNDCMNRYCGGW